MMMRVNVNELDDEYTPAGSLVMLWEGEPFTGVAFELSPQGTLWSEQTYVEGTLDGISRDWYPNGQLRSHTEYKWNRIHGREQGWYENGQLKCNVIYELGTVIRKREWDERGNITKDYQIEDDAWAAEHLKSQRELFRKLGIHYQLSI